MFRAILVAHVWLAMLTSTAQASVVTRGIALFEFTAVVTSQEQICGFSGCEEYYPDPVNTSQFARLKTGTLYSGFLKLIFPDVDANYPEITYECRIGGASCNYSDRPDYPIVHGFAAISLDLSIYTGDGCCFASSLDFKGKTYYYEDDDLPYFNVVEMTLSDVTLTKYLDLPAVPVPASLPLLVVGLVGLGLLKRRQKMSSCQSAY